MKKVLQITIVLFFLAFAGIQFIRPNRTNPPVNQQLTLESQTEVPADVSAVLKRSCNDCHSNETIYPWYSNIAPISWEVVEHIELGRAELNFSEWGNYKIDQKLRRLDEMCEEIESGEMPHDQYLWIHWDAVLSDEEKRKVCEWTEKEVEKLRASDKR